YVAYTIANLTRQLLAEGALSASFVPVFSRTFSTSGKKTASELAREALFVLLIGGTAVVLLGILFAPLFVHVMAPGFAAPQRELAISLTRAMFPFLLMVSVGALAMGVLNSMGSFFVPAVAPALSNLVYILFLLLTIKHITVWNLAIAVLLGGISHMLLQWYWCLHMDVPLIPSVPKKDNAELKNMMALFLPYAAGLSLNQINPVISRMLGSFLEGGSISVLTYADRILQLPLGLFVIAISQAVLPMLSRQDPEDTLGFKDFIRDALRFNLFVVTPVAIGLFIVSSEFVHLLFYRGAFSEWAWHSTATALALYGLGLPGMATSTLVLRAMYARRMPRAAVMVTAVTVSVNLCASLMLMPVFRYAGLAAAVATAFTSASVYGCWALSRNLDQRLGIFDKSWVIKILPSLAVMIIIVTAIKYLTPYPYLSGVVVRAAWLISVMLLGAGAYAASTIILKCPEWQWIRGAVVKK
ncbi:MAG: murein biosynthesis integral membrane protein MurJ, partial [Synergistaceae bacterium]|nr:murein biosynthesis integral membrane protein MurJ [Synergistaceae bacterium]